ncbi:MAG: prepilin-type cleavage/methylation domain-containing protein [SAR86 cluster bacterium]|uniref:Prepilin-type cleavage/methylation domain-containing protein n=1 Tax=SAR86 cluster bacterium TaxID=2030880 RepID=A0A2A5CAU5_9GAMM|nr:MAG: prepilin-type cleavage/methylation domain-containing protein [SAR86 cluster bacterium]
MKKLSTIKGGKTQGGFTLIEIAIVLVIIGLLLGGVLQGQQLIENSRIRNAVNSFNGIAAATFSYQDRYGRLPGDDSAGNTALPATIQARGSSWGAVTQGDSNGVVAALLANTFTGLATGESGDFFQHLRAAGFIAGDPALAGALALPQNAFGGLIGITSDSMGGGLTGLKICMGSVNGSAAIALDTQLDDGSGLTGRFRSTLGDANIAPASTVLAAAYSEDNIYTICYRM